MWGECVYGMHPYREEAIEGWRMGIRGKYAIVNLIYKVL